MIVDFAKARHQKHNASLGLPAPGIAAGPTHSLDELVSCLTECREIEHTLIALQDQSAGLNARLSQLRLRAQALVEAQKGQRHEAHPLIG